jgi:hypothetical protein
MDLWDILLFGDSHWQTSNVLQVEKNVQPDLDSNPEALEYLSAALPTELLCCLNSEQFWAVTYFPATSNFSGLHSNVNLALSYIQSRPPLDAKMSQGEKNVQPEWDLNQGAQNTVLRLYPELSGRLHTFSPD